MQLELRDYFNVLRKRWWLILLVALGAAAAGCGYSKLQTPIYESSVQLQLVPNRPDNGLIEFLRKNITTYTAGLTSADFINTVLTANRGDLDDVTTEEVQSRIKTQAQPDNSLVVMTVDDVDPVRAAALANALADAYTLQVNAQAQTNQSDLKIFMQKVDTARPPARPSQPRTTLNTVAAAALGLVLGLILAFALEFTDTTLKTSDEVQRFLGLTTVGLIPAGKRHGERS